MGASSSGRSRDVVLLATADWDHPFWTNKQHVAVALASLGHRVLYVESVGLRPPRMEVQDLRRIWRRCSSFGISGRMAWCTSSVTPRVRWSKTSSERGAT